MLDRIKTAPHTKASKISSSDIVLLRRQLQELLQVIKNFHQNCHILLAINIELEKANSALSLPKKMIATLKILAQNPYSSITINNDSSLADVNAALASMLKLFHSRQNQQILKAIQTYASYYSEWLQKAPFVIEDPDLKKQFSRLWVENLQKALRLYQSSVNQFADLTTLTILPIQSIPRIPLLLETMNKQGASLPSLLSLKNQYKQKLEMINSSKTPWGMYVALTVGIIVGLALIATGAGTLITLFGIGGVLAGIGITKAVGISWLISGGATLTCSSIGLKIRHQTLHSKEKNKPKRNSSSTNTIFKIIKVKLFSPSPSEQKPVNKQKNDDHFTATQRENNMQPAMNKRK